MNDETYEFEGMQYVKPELSRDEQLSFIDNLRETQKQSNEQIAQQTYSLGSDLPANLGGLDIGTGENSYFMKRYQTPQVNSQVAALRTAAQQSALNQVLSNLKSQYQARYNEAYRKYQKRGADSSGSNNQNDSSKINMNTNVYPDGIAEQTSIVGYVTPEGTKGTLQVFVDSGGHQYIKDLRSEIDQTGAYVRTIPKGGAAMSLDDLAKKGWQFSTGSSSGSTSASVLGDPAAWQPYTLTAAMANNK